MMAITDPPPAQLRNTPARHYKNFSFLAINPDYQGELDERVEQLTSRVAAERTGLKKSKRIILAHEEMPVPPTTPFRSETAISVSPGLVEVVVMPGDDLSRYHTRKAIEESLERPESREVKTAIAQFVDALTLYSAEITVCQMMNPPTDMHRMGAPRIESPSDLVMGTFARGPATTHQHFHTDEAPQILVGRSPYSVLLTERETPLLGFNDDPIRMLDPGVPDDGRNIPASMVHCAKPGEVAVWDGTLASHTPPDLDEIVRPFDRLKFRMHDANQLVRT